MKSLVSGDWLLAMVRKWIGGEKADFWRKKSGWRQWERVKQTHRDDPIKRHSATLRDFNLFGFKCSQTPNHPQPNGPCRTVVAATPSTKAPRAAK